MKKFVFLVAFILCGAIIAHGQWIYNNLTQPKSAMGSVSHGSKAYFAGGNSDFSLLASIEVYNVAVEAWDTVMQLSAARQFPACIAAGDKIFFAGGCSFNNTPPIVFDRVDIWNTVTKQWTTTQLSIPRTFAAVVSKGNKVLFAGGVHVGTLVLYDVVDIYDLTTGTWSDTYLSMPRAGMACAVVGDLAYFAGGEGPVTRQASDRIDIYNFSTQTWSIDTLPVARVNMGAAVVGDKILFAGGIQADNTPSSRVDIYNTTNGTWTVSALSEPKALWMNNVAVVNGNAYFAGGGVLDIINHNWTDATKMIDIYKGSDGTWHLDSLTNPLINHAVAGAEDHLLVAGGVAGPAWANVSKVEICIDQSAGIPSNHSNMLPFDVYPNPVHGNIHIEIPGYNPQKNLKLLIYNMMGENVIHQAIANSHLELPLKLPPGMYLLKLISDDAMGAKLITVK